MRGSTSFSPFELDRERVQDTVREKILAEEVVINGLCSASAKSPEPSLGSQADQSHGRNKISIISGKGGAGVTLKLTKNVYIVPIVKQLLAVQASILPPPSHLLWTSPRLATAEVPDPSLDDAIADTKTACLAH